LDTLKGNIVRIKAERVKEGVEKLAGLFNNWIKIRHEVNCEVKNIVKTEITKREALSADTKIVDRVEASEEKILGALSALSTKVLENETAITKLADARTDTYLRMDRCRQEAHENG